MLSFINLPIGDDYMAPTKLFAQHTFTVEKHEKPTFIPQYLNQKRHRTFTGMGIWDNETLKPLSLPLGVCKGRFDMMYK